jgi:hypothetical protein
VHTRSTPGFIVNRVARPFYAESLRLLQEGAADCATLDALMREAGGFRMGAFELTDLIGHDVNYAVTCSVFDAFYGDFRFQPSLVQKELVDAGRLGARPARASIAMPRAPSARSRPNCTARQRRACAVEGDLGVMQPLVERLRQSGIAVTQRAGSGLMQVGDATLALSDGRLASQRAREDGLRNLVLLDLALDYSSATRIAISWPPIPPTAPATRPLPCCSAPAWSPASPTCPAWWYCAPWPCSPTKPPMPCCRASAAPPTSTWPCAPASITPAARWPGPNIGVGHTLRVLDNLQRSYGENATALPCCCAAAEGGPCMTEVELAQACAEAMFARDQASQGLGISLLDAGPGRASLRMTVRADMIQGHGTCHGGFCSPWPTRPSPSPATATTKPPWRWAAASTTWPRRCAATSSPPRQRSQPQRPHRQLRRAHRKPAGRADRPVPRQILQSARHRAGAGDAHD